MSSFFSQYDLITIARAGGLEGLIEVAHLSPKNPKRYILRRTWLEYTLITVKWISLIYANTISSVYCRIRSKRRVHLELCHKNPGILESARHFAKPERLSNSTVRRFAPIQAVKHPIRVRASPIQAVKHPIRRRASNTKDQNFTKRG